MCEADEGAGRGRVFVVFKGSFKDSLTFEDIQQPEAGFLLEAPRRAQKIEISYARTAKKVRACVCVCVFSREARRRAQKIGIS